jgi:hypothetical protein
MSVVRCAIRWITILVFGMFRRMVVIRAGIRFLERLRMRMLGFGVRLLIGGVGV